MRAVFAPRLGQGLQLDVGRVPPDRAEVVDDRMELGGVERQATLAVERLETVVVEAHDLDELDAGIRRGIAVDERRARSARATTVRSPGWPAAVGRASAMVMSSASPCTS